MKLSDWAKKTGVSYKTAWNYFNQGTLKGYKLPSGTIIIEGEKQDIQEKIAIYCRVSSSENKSNLDSQAERVYNYCVAKGYSVDHIVKEIGSGLNDNRQKLKVLLNDQSITRIVVEHKDRFARFGTAYIEQLLEQQGRTLEIINKAEEDESDLIQDFVSIITSFCARLYGKRRSKRKTEQLINELKED